MLCNRLHHVVLLLATNYLLASGEINITEIMIREGIVPDVIPKAPPELLRCFFPHGELKPGDILNMYQCNLPPKLNYTYEPDAFYTVMMIGVTKWNQSRHLKKPFCNSPDIYATTESPPKYRKSMQWLVVNIPENRVKEGYLRKNYIPSIHVFEKTIAERFVLLLYKQNSSYDFDHPPTKFARMIRAQMSPGMKATKLFVNAIDFLHEYYYTNQAPIAGNYYDGEVSSEEYPLFDSLDHKNIKHLEKLSSMWWARGFKMRTESRGVDSEVLYA